MMSIIHASAEVHSESLGKHTRVWQSVVVLSGAIIGDDCNICSHCFIENDVRIGDRVTIKSGVQLWDGITVEDDVFIGPNATFTNDKHPRSREYSGEVFKTMVCKGASVGANATLLPGIKIGPYAMVGAGAVVTRDVPDRAIVVGNPARIIGYVNTDEVHIPKLEVSSPVEESKVKGVFLTRLNNVKDMRGDLSSIEWDRELPFTPKRTFFVYGVPDGRVRGEHAHLTCDEFLVCMSGSVSVIVDDGSVREEYLLNERSLGLYLPKMTWTIQYKYSSDAVLFVLASHVYEAEDYIRDFDEYLEIIKK